MHAWCQKLQCDAPYQNLPLLQSAQTMKNSLVVSPHWSDAQWRMRTNRLLVVSWSPIGQTLACLVQSLWAQSRPANSLSSNRNIHKIYTTLAATEHTKWRLISYLLSVKDAPRCFNASSPHQQIVLVTLNRFEESSLVFKTCFVTLNNFKECSLVFKALIWGVYERSLRYQYQNYGWIVTVCQNASWEIM